MSNSNYQVLNEITLDKEALISNYRYFTSLNPHAQIAPVLKSNAYGHGIHEIAKLVDNSLNAPFICVDSLYEAYELYKLAINTPIFIMGYTNPVNYSVRKKLPFTFAVFDKESLISLNTHQPGAKVHIKLDTGMCRLGLRESDLDEFIKTLNKCKNIMVDGIFSHLSQADIPKSATFTSRQISKFKKMVSVFESHGYEFSFKHISATSGASYIEDPYFNLVRLGLGLYGYTPFGPHTGEGRVGRKILKPVLELTTHVAQIKEIPLGSQVGYGGTYISKQKETIAILPIGYNEGVSRLLSNKGQFTLNNGNVCDIIGTVCMNMTIVRLPRKNKVRVGDKVKIISKDQKAPNSIYRHAQLMNEIEYTILTGLHPTIKRSIK